MKKRFFAALSRFCAISGLALLLSGCLPEEFLWWSPDGRVAAIRTPEGLRLSDANGHLSEVVLTGEIQRAAWSPDGASLVVCRSLKLTNWSTVEALVPREERDEVLRLARAFPNLVKAGLIASGGSLEGIDEKLLKPLGIKETDVLEPTMHCALSLHGEEIRDVLATFTNAAALESGLLSFQAEGITVHEICILRISGNELAGEPQPLVHSLRELQDPAVSPGFSFVAYRAGKEALKVLSLDGKASRTVAEEKVASAAWSGDGRSLFYVVMAESDMLGEICTQRVLKENGELLEAAAAAKTETLALGVFTGGASPRLAVLPDGRLLFASMAMTVPARADSVPANAQFFLLDPSRSNAAPVALAIREGSLPADLSTFAVNPNGHFVAVAESGTDAVAVLELATGKVQIISPAHPGWKCRIVPTWRNARELTFAALPSSSATRPELQLWQGGSTRTLSKAWPDAVVKPWLEAPEADSRH